MDYLWKELKTVSEKRAWTELRQQRNENTGCSFINVGFYKLLGISGPLVLFISSCSPKGIQSSFQQKWYYINKPLHSKEGQGEKQMLLKLVLDSLASCVENTSCKPQSKSLRIMPLVIPEKGRGKAILSKDVAKLANMLFSPLPAPSLHLVCS